MFFTERAAADTNAANCAPADVLIRTFHMLAASLRIKQVGTGTAFKVVLSLDCHCGASLYANITFPAAYGHAGFSFWQGHIRQHRGKTYTGTKFRADEQDGFSYPTQPRKHSGGFVLEQAVVGTIGTGQAL